MFIYRYIADTEPIAFECVDGLNASLATCWDASKASIQLQWNGASSCIMFLVFSTPFATRVVCEVFTCFCSEESADDCFCDVLGVCLRMSRGDAGCMMLYGGVTLRTSTIWKNIVTSSDLMIFEWWAKCRNPQNLSCNHLGGVYCVIGPILRYPLPLSLLGGFACALSKLQPSSNPQSRCGAVPLSKSLPKKEDFLCGILAVQKMWIDLGWFQHVSTRFNHQSLTQNHRHPSNDLRHTLASQNCQVLGGIQPH